MIFIFLYKSYYYIIILTVDKSLAFIIARRLFFLFLFLAATLVNQFITDNIILSSRALLSL